MTRRDLIAALPGAGDASGARGATTLKVGAALPDPPFEFVGPAGPSGFDIALMQRIAAKLGRVWQLVRYEGADFNGIFGGLDSGAYDCVASGTTITPGREKIADFCAPYAVSGQSLVVDATRHPQVHGVDDLKGLVIGVQHGNTSEPVAEMLVAGHRAAPARAASGPRLWWPSRTGRRRIPWRSRRSAVTARRRLYRCRGIPETASAFPAG